MTTVAINNLLMTREGVPADVVYAMTKAMFDNLPELTAAHAAAKGIVARTGGAGLAGAAAPRRRALLPGEGRTEVGRSGPRGRHGCWGTFIGGRVEIRTDMRHRAAHRGMTTRRTLWTRIG